MAFSASERVGQQTSQLLRAAGQSEQIRRHCQAWSQPKSDQLEGPVRNAILAWADYADAFRVHHGYTIGQDYLATEHWAAWASALHGLLNYSIGGLDGGSLSGLMHVIARDQGVNLDTGEPL